MRLQSVLSQAGIASRRKVVLLIEAGKVSVNGALVLKPGLAVDPDRDDIRFENRRIRFGTKVYYAFHKPRNVVSTMKDTHGRRTIEHFFGRLQERVFPVGRLDQDTTGLILVTNDGDFANRLMHPRYGCFKTYEVRLKSPLTAEAIRAAEAGIIIESGKTAPCQIRFTKKIGHAYLYEMVLREGKKRQIRYMMKALRVFLIHIHRVSIGPVRLGSLKEGRSRALTPDEIKSLMKEDSPS